MRQHASTWVFTIRAYGILQDLEFSISVDEHGFWRGDLSHFQGQNFTEGLSSAFGSPAKFLGLFKGKFFYLCFSVMLSLSHIKAVAKISLGYSFLRSQITDRVRTQETQSRTHQIQSFGTTERVSQRGHFSEARKTLFEGSLRKIWEKFLGNTFRHHNHRFHTGIPLSNRLMWKIFSRLCGFALEGIRIGEGQRV